MKQIQDHGKPIFRNLDGIRFIAFLCIFFSHTFYTADHSVSASQLYRYVTFFGSHWGDFGLSVFFVMSGFLITYLLMHERQTYGNVHVLSFYARRILRIWPLYFTIVLFNFFVYTRITHNQEFAAHQMPYYFFYANMDVITHGFNNGVIGHLWAISVEEQFYLTLPLIMLFVPDRRLHYAFIAVIAASQIFRMVHFLEPPMIFFHSLSASFEIALGGLAARLMYFNAQAKDFIANLSSRAIIIAYCFFIAVILFQDYIFSTSQLIIAVLLSQLFGAFIILEQNYATHSFIKVGNLRWVTTLGKYSFGLFCYHIVSIRFAETMAFKLNIKDVFGDVIFIPALSLAMTIMAGVASYHLFEIHFLNLKKKFAYLK